MKIQKRCRKPGSCRTLKTEQEKQLQAIIRDKTPDQLKLPFDLWTRLAVQQVIRHLWGIRMPIRPVGDYLKHWGLTPQKAFRRAYDQNPKAVGKWLREECPAIAQWAKKEHAKIHWGNEHGLSKGGSQDCSNAPQGQMRFMVDREVMNAGLMNKFLGRLVKDVGCKELLILDNVEIHQSRPVQERLEKHKQEIEVSYMPAYFQEFNSDEYLNNDIKTGVYSGDPARTWSQAQEKTLWHLRMLQEQPLKVKKFFEHPKVAYHAYSVKNRI